MENGNLKWNKKLHYIKVDLLDTENKNKNSNNNNKLNITIINQHYLKYNNKISLSNQALPYNIKNYPDYNTITTILSFFSSYFQIFFLLSLLFSFGSLNTGF
jgi:hypothetical protein